MTLAHQMTLAVTFDNNCANTIFMTLYYHMPRKSQESDHIKCHNIKSRINFKYKNVGIMLAQRYN